MASYDMTQQFYSPYIHQDLQLIEFGRLPKDITPNEHTGEVIIDSTGKVAIKILGKNSTGQVVAKKYKLAEVDASVLKAPVLGDLKEVDGSFMKLNRWQSQLQNRHFRNTTNDNWDNLEKAINNILDNETIIGIFLNSLSSYLDKLNIDLESMIKNAVSDYLNDNYYSKSEVDAKLKLLNQKIDNVQARVNAAPAIGPYANPSRTDQYPSNLDVNDQVTPEAEKIIEDWNK